MILFFGPPGSGKSVQGKLLVERNKWQWISTGELFRNSSDPEVLQRLATGALIDDELTNRVLGDALVSVDPASNVILDGYPRNQDQAEWLDSNADTYGRQVDCVVLFKVPREVLITRLTDRGRAEDTKEVVEHRLDIYEATTRPVVDYYLEHSVPVLEVDGVGDIQEIHERIQVVVSECLKLK
jgi:adenylate kinase